MSKELATIYCQVPLEFSQEALARHPFDREALLALYKELELRSLLKELLSQYPEPEAVMEAEPEVDLDTDEETSFQPKKGIKLTEPSQLEQVVAEHQPKNIAVLVNRTAGNVHTAKVQFIGLLVGDQPYMVDCAQGFGQFAQVLKPWMESEAIMILTDDAKKLHGSFLAEQIHVKSIFWDSTLMAYLLNPESKDLSLEGLLAQFYDILLPEDPEEHLYGLLKGVFVLAEPLMERLEQENLLQLYAQIELPLTVLLSQNIFYKFIILR